VNRWRWGNTVRVLSLLTAAFFFVSAVLLVVLDLNLTGDPPFGGVDFIDETIKVFAWEQSRWPIDFAGSLSLALGFLALGGVGVLLARLADVTDTRRSLIAAAMLVGATMGAASQLFWIGVRPIATDPQFCDCGFRAEEIMSRLMTLNVASGVQAWLINGAIALILIGVLTVAGLVRRAGISAGWVWISYLLVVGAVLVAVLGELRAYPYDLISLPVLTGLLVPAWAVWLAIEAPRLEAPDAAEWDEVDLPPEPTPVSGG
jgi:hypothetical protein